MAMGSCQKRRLSFIDDLAKSHGMTKPKDRNTRLSALLRMRQNNMACRICKNALQRSRSVLLDTILLSRQVFGKQLLPAALGFYDQVAEIAYCAAASCMLGHEMDKWSKLRHAIGHGGGESDLIQSG